MLLGALFFIVAMFYASVGFGGGSSYLALLALAGLPFAAIPALALVCNVVVVAGNSIHFFRARQINWKLIAPPTLAAMPMAFLGGKLPISKETFMLLLFATLLVAGIRLLVQHKTYGDNPQSYRPFPIWLGVSVGASLGFLSGVVGIGGGIFLAPLLYNFRVAPPKHIAATASIFILLNSLAGLAGQLHKSGISDALFAYWYLPVVVLIGGQLGNILTLKHFKPSTIALFTALLVLFVALRLGWQIWLV